MSRSRRGTVVAGYPGDEGDLSGSAGGVGRSGQRPGRVVGAGGRRRSAVVRPDTARITPGRWRRWGVSRAVHWSPPRYRSSSVSGSTGRVDHGMMLAASEGPGIGSEYRAERAARALHSAVRHSVIAVGDWQPSSVDVTEPVPRDVVRLRLGAVVPAGLLRRPPPGVQTRWLDARCWPNDWRALRMSAIRSSWSPTRPAP